MCRRRVFFFSSFRGLQFSRCIQRKGPEGKVLLYPPPRRCLCGEGSGESPLASLLLERVPIFCFHLGAAGRPAGGASQQLERARAGPHTGKGVLGRKHVQTRRSVR
jgi:hypothetical protein